MEHEVFVPVPADRLRAALSDPARVARAVPGLQQEAGAAPVAGRLKVRVAGHTITYRGALRVAGRDDGSYTVEGDGTEARGSGSVKLRLTVRILAAEDGTTLAFTGTATADGRVADLPADAVSTTVTRLLNRFGGNLARVSDEDAGREREQGREHEQGQGQVSGSTGIPRPAEQPPAEQPPKEQPPAEQADVADVPPSSEPSSSEPLSAAAFDDGSDDDSDAGTEGGLVPEALASEGFASGELAGREEPPAEAAHARRTMIGRSAEEVDHAPPRGRYAPVPAPESTVAGPALRWAAPAAALALASAIVVTRALRKRR